MVQQSKVYNCPTVYPSKVQSSRFPDFDVRFTEDRLHKHCCANSCAKNESNFTCKRATGKKTRAGALTNEVEHFVHWIPCVKGNQLNHAAYCITCLLNITAPDWIIILLHSCSLADIDFPQIKVREELTSLCAWYLRHYIFAVQHCRKFNDTR